MSLHASDRKSFTFGGVTALGMIACWTWALFFVTTEQHQGEVYRIIYLHVPAAFTAFLCSFLLLIFSVISLFRTEERHLRAAKACAEVGFIFTVLTLATGSIWGKPTWGTWWTWDARLTTTFILGLLYAGYLLLYHSMQPGPGRIKIAAVIGILIAADVPIIYKSVTWWRTIHQPPSIKPTASTISAEILVFLLICVAATFAFAAWMMWARGSNMKLNEELEDASYQQMNG